MQDGVRDVALKRCAVTRLDHYASAELWKEIHLISPCRDRCILQCYGIVLAEVLQYTRYAALLRQSILQWLCDTVAATGQDHATDGILLGSLYDQLAQEEGPHPCTGIKGKKIREGTSLRLLTGT